jgi:hypothetical protein
MNMRVADSDIDTGGFDSGAFLMIMITMTMLDAKIDKVY